MDKKILDFCLKKGFLVDEEMLKLLHDTGDLESVKKILENIKNSTEKKIITRKLFEANAEQVDQFLLTLPEKARANFEKLKIKLGLSIEISKEFGSKKISEEPIELDKSKNSVKIIAMAPTVTKKIEVQDFINYFRARYSELRNILQENPILSNPISISKIFGDRRGISVIGMVSDKRITKNKNFLFEIEDLTGKIRVVVNKNNTKVYEKAEDIALDSVIGFKGSGNQEILFANEVVFPEPNLLIRKKSLVEEYALFIGDLHFGSKLFMEKNFLNFIDYLNGKIPNTPEVQKIKYLFIVGDLVTGVGNYPNQERDLKILDLEEQFSGVAKLLGKIRKDIKIIISPGNHDGVRLMEPQPLFDEKYAWALYNLENVILTGNPASVNIGAKKDFPGFDVLTYHGFSFPYYANNVSKLTKKKAMNSPEEIMKYLLKHRHLAPTHTSTQYFPHERDWFLINSVPDILVSAHTHKSAVTHYNNILLISVSCWEKMTSYQEKFGNEPDHCKVPMFNLKTRQVKILDFEGENENRN